VTITTVRNTTLTRQTLQAGAAIYVNVTFKAVTFVAGTKSPGFWFDNCAFHSCTFVYDGMEVDYQEWVSLMQRKRRGDDD
jgi:hypothetical protein